jgi:hypothetical protein
MQKIIVIGTLHAGLTPNSELEELLNKYKPDQLLIEMRDEDLKKGHIKLYPREMQFAYRWGKQQNIIMNGFDSLIDTLSKGMREANNLKVIEKQKKIMKQYNWKDMNKPKNNKLLEKAAKGLCDPKKEIMKNQEMIRNIEKIKKKGTIIILTGCAHLDFFEKHLPRAKFPLR